MMIINCRLLVPCRDRRMVLADDCILRFEVSSSKHFILFRTLGMVKRWKFLRTLSRTKLTTLLSYLKLFRISLQRFVFVSETLTKLTKWRGSNDFPFDMFLHLIATTWLSPLLFFQFILFFDLVYTSTRFFSSIRRAVSLIRGWAVAGLANVTTLHRNVGLNKRPPSEHLLPTNFFIQLRVYKSTGERRARTYLRAPTKVQELPACTHNCVSHGCLR